MEPEPFRAFGFKMLHEIMTAVHSKVLPSFDELKVLDHPKVVNAVYI